MTLPAQTPRTPARLSDSLHRQLNMYALAATAAGVGALAMAQPAQAEIVYTPTHQKLPVNRDFFLDLNHDGVNDFKFFMLTSVSTHGCFVELTLDRLHPGNAAVPKLSSGSFFASALKAGVRIGKTQYFPNQSWEFMGMMNQYVDSGNYRGPWVSSGEPVNHRYLGLRFEIKGKTHYGWARLNVWIYACRASATLTGYAYETVTNKPIVAGNTKGPDDNEQQPNPAEVVPSGTLGRLALGRK